jgi:hypothetical protein
MISFGVGDRAEPLDSTPHTKEHNMNSKTTVIKCKHHVGPGRKLCGAERTIQVQDAFQVKRCVAHQKEYAAERRRARAKAKRQAAKKAD